MRIIHYAVINTETSERFFAGTNHFKAEEKLAELQRANPDDNFMIVYKFVSI